MAEARARLLSKGKLQKTRDDETKNEGERGSICR